jgi:hypothetical protein
VILTKEHQEHLAAVGISAPIQDQCFVDPAELIEAKNLWRQTGVPEEEVEKRAIAHVVWARQHRFPLWKPVPYKSDVSPAGTLVQPVVDFDPVIKALKPIHEPLLAPQPAAAPITVKAPDVHVASAVVDLSEVLTELRILGDIGTGIKRKLDSLSQAEIHVEAPDFRPLLNELQNLDPILEQLRMMAEKNHVINFDSPEINIELGPLLRWLKIQASISAAAGLVALIAAIFFFLH